MSVYLSINHSIYLSLKILWSSYFVIHLCNQDPVKTTDYYE